GEAYESPALEVSQGDSGLLKGGEEILRAERGVPLGLEIGEGAREPGEIHPVASRIGTRCGGVLHGTTRDRPLHDLGQLADLIILAVRTDVEGLIVDGLPG